MTDDKMRNDTSMTDEQALEALKNAVDIRFGEVGLRVSPDAIKDAEASLALLNAEERLNARVSIVNALTRFEKKFKKNTFTKKEWVKD